MDITSCCASDAGDDCVQLAPKNQGDDDEGDDGAEILAAAQKGLGTDDEGDDGAELTDDEGDEGAEVLAAAQNGVGIDNVLSILGKKPGLIRIGDPMGDTVVHLAARAGDVVTVCKLIAFMEEREDLELKRVLTDTNVDGDTPLHLALKNGHREVAYHLVTAEKKAATMYNNDGMSPYTLAIEAGFRELVSAMLFSNIMQSAFADVEMEVVKRALAVGFSSGVDIHWNELCTAIKEGIDDVIMTGLMKDGKNLLCYRSPRTGETLLHVAVKAGDGRGPLKRIVQFMITNGLTDAALLGTRHGDTALHLALQYRHLTEARCLIEAAPGTVYQVNHEGVSPLHLAVKAGYQDVVKHMLEMVSQNGLPACATEILRHPKNATLAHLAIKTRASGTLQTMMEHLPQLINVKDEKGWRPLSYAANKGCLDEVTYMLSNFPKWVEKYDRDGSLPIHKAVAGGHVSIIQTFLKHCPQALYHVDKKGRSVLHIAVRYAGYARDDILAYLTKEIKMDDSLLNLKDNEGKTFKDYKELKR